MLGVQGGQQRNGGWLRAGIAVHQASVGFWMGDTQKGSLEWMLEDKGQQKLSS